MKHNLDLNLLPDFQKWKKDLQDPEFSLWNYLYFKGSPELAVSFTELFWPNFVEVENCILLEKNYKLGIFQDWKTKLKGNKTEIEKIINHVHIYDLFQGSSENIELKIYEYLAENLLKFWKLAIHNAFPGKGFEFIFTSEPEDYGPTITFFEKEK